LFKYFLLDNVPYNGFQCYEISYLEIAPIIPIDLDFNPFHCNNK